MEYSEWAPHYHRIQKEFSFRFSREKEAATLLLHLLPEKSRRTVPQRLRARVLGKDAIVVGLGPNLGAPPMWQLPGTFDSPVLLAADGATARCLDGGLIPEVVVTDLDGPIPSEVTASAKGALAVIHAHGDNIAALKKWVGHFTGELVGSWAGPPGNGLINVGGFTDGDRAAFLAEHFGARRILLWGFDFSRVEEEETTARRRKLAKLRWAKDLLSLLASRAPGRVFLWTNPETILPFPAQAGGPSTQ